MPKVQSIQVNIYEDSEIAILLEQQANIAVMLRDVARSQRPQHITKAATSGLNALGYGCGQSGMGTPLLRLCDAFNSKAGEVLRKVFPQKK